MKLKTRSLCGSDLVYVPQYLCHGLNPFVTVKVSKINGMQTKSDVSRHGSQIALLENGTAESGRSFFDNPIDYEIFIDEFQEDFHDYAIFHDTKHEKHSVHVKNRNEQRIFHVLRESNSVENSSCINMWKNKKRIWKKLDQDGLFANTDRKKNWRSEALDKKSSLNLSKLSQSSLGTVVSLLNGYIRRFLRDKNFRLSIRSKCHLCLRFSKSKDRQIHAKIITNLKQAMKTVEGMIGKQPRDLNDLKRVVSQLNVTASLNQYKSKKRFTSGITNMNLSACANLYLSVVRHLQGNEKMSANHLLQVFCDCPFQARTILLSDLWNHLFLPQFSYLRIWYDQEVESIIDISSTHKNVELLEKEYDKMLDSGTYQFALYFKDCLAVEDKVPVSSSFKIPSLFVLEDEEQGSHHPFSGRVSGPTASVSSKLLNMKDNMYEPISRQTIKSNGDCEIGSSMKNFNFSTINVEEENKGGAYYLGPQMCSELGLYHMKKHGGCHQDEEFSFTLQEKRREPEIPPYPREDKSGNPHDHSSSLSSKEGITTATCQFQHSKENETILKKLATAIFHLQQVEDPSDVRDPSSWVSDPCDSVFDVHKKSMACGRLEKSDLDLEQVLV